MESTWKAAQTIGTHKSLNGYESLDKINGSHSKLHDCTAFISLQSGNFGVNKTLAELKFRILLSVQCQKFIKSTKIVHPYTINYSAKHLLS